MNRPYTPSKLSLKIDDLGSHGEGVGHPDGYTVFVDGALPGEIVEAQLFENKSAYGKAHLLSIIDPSPNRVKPSCPLFGKCGGCQLMHLEYQEQLRVKQQRVLSALKRIGKINDVDVPLCIASPSPLAYRNKIQLPVRPRGNTILLGMFARASHDLIEVDTCQIHCSLGDTVYREVKALISASTIIPYDPSTGKGELRHLLIKSAVHCQEVLVILVAATAGSAAFTALAAQIMSHCPEVKGVVLNTNKKSDNVILGSIYKTLAGTESIHEKLGDLLFKVSPASFFQVNSRQALQLYSKAIEWAQLDGTERVLDAYCGVGTLSLFFAKHAKQVLGVECVPDAIADAKINASLNKIDNVSFVCDQTESYIKSLSSIDIVILNPPRKGCDPVVLKELHRLSPKTIIYISCDPGTLARDLATLRNFDFTIDAIQPFDMFPQTAHVECVVKLSKLNSHSHTAVIGNAVKESPISSTSTC